MKLVVENRDVGQLLEKVVWSGDLTQAARRLDFTLAFKPSDYYLPKPVVNIGNKVTLYTDEGKLLFFGQIFSRSLSANANTISFVAFDLLIFLTKSKINKIFDTTPEEITKKVCEELGVPFGGAVSTGIPMYLPALGKTGYETVMAAYTKASLVTGKKYMPKMEADKLHVIEVGSELSGVLLDGGSSVVDASYSESIENMINRVIIANKNNDTTGTVENADDRAAYGTLQDVYKEEDGKDAQSAARGLLKHMERTAGITALSDLRCVTGYAVSIRESNTNLIGRFYITSDSHTFQNGKTLTQMQLGLSFMNTMDEKEVETQSG